MEPNTSETQGSSLGETPNLGRNKKRLEIFLHLSRFDILEPRIEGRELLPNVPCVIATTHLSSIDIQEIALVVAKDRKIGMASQATNLTMLKPIINLIGAESFFPISNRLEKGKPSSAFRLKAEEMEALGRAVSDDRITMLIAAHRPTRDWKLPDKPGLAAVIVAHEANAPLIPIALDIESKTPVGVEIYFPPRIRRFFQRKRPTSRIIIREAIPLSQIPREKLEAAINLYSTDKRRQMTESEQEEAKDTLQILQNEAGEVMESLAAKLPPEKRGRWLSGPSKSELQS